MMESEVMGNYHASFGERDRETRMMRIVKVRPVPTPFSPLLANIALHGLEKAIKEAYPRKKNSVALVRYADDFVVIHQDRAVVEHCQTIISEWLKDMGLELKPSKTRITHTLHADEGQAGFDFLGTVKK